jgi:diguanylate cyclase (GGDEF)-like protein/PAS domain S-box-containing protein/putative nucleotidyltransferase with HDIG domain
MINEIHADILKDLPFPFAYCRIILDDEQRPSDYTVLVANDRFCRMLGVSRGRMIGKPISKVIPAMWEKECQKLDVFHDIAKNLTETEYQQTNDHDMRDYHVRVYSSRKDHFIKVYADITAQLKLSRASENFLNTFGETIDYQKITDDIRTLSGAKYAAFNVFKENGLDFQTVALSGIHQNIQKAIRVLGFNPLNKTWEHDPHRAKRIEKSQTTYFHALHELADYAVSSALIRVLEKMFGVRRAIVVKITKDGRMLGDFTLMMPVHEKPFLESTLETYASQVGLFLEKQRALEALGRSEAEYRHLIENIGEVFFRISLEGVITYASSATRALLGYDVEEIRGKSAASMIHLEDRANVETKIKEIANTNEKTRLDYRIMHKDGDVRWHTSTITPLYDDDDQMTGFMGTAHDITYRKRIEEELKRSESTLQTIFSHLHFGIALYDYVKDSIVYTNEQFLELYGVNKDQMTRAKDVYRAITDDPKRQKMLEEVVVKAMSSDDPEKMSWDDIMIDRGGEKRFLAAYIIKIPDSNMIVSTARDITESIYKQRQIEYVSYHDYLTDLYNRRFYEKKLTELDHKENLPLGLMLIDLNGLKLINDAYGHTVGDKALKIVAETLKELGDPGIYAARVGGDEFALLVPNTCEADMNGYAERIKERLSRVKIDHVMISVAIGYAIKFRSEEDVYVISKSAEDTMYRHKITEGSSARNRTIQTILTTLTEKYSYERTHSKRVSAMCLKMGRALGLSDDDQKELALAGLFHDIGKIAIPDHILGKQEALTAEEYERMKTHTEAGYQILRAADEYSNLAEYALYHHERYDGKGYPTGLKGDKIPYFARIISIADAYEAMTSERSYRVKKTKEEAIIELRACAGRQFDPELTETFIKHVVNKA